MFPTNDPHQKERRQMLRNNMTPAEKILWKYLRSKQLNGVKFRRQFGLGPYILDFYCHEKKLCIEVDGENHFTSEGISYDRERTHFLGNHGITVLRYSNTAVYENVDGVMASIHDKITQETHTPPNLP